MLRSLLVASLICAPAFAQQPTQIPVGEAAAFTMQEVTRAYAIGSQALNACQQSNAELKAKIAELEKQLAEAKK